MYRNILGRRRLLHLVLIDIVVLALSFVGAFFIRFDLSFPATYGNLILRWLPILAAVKIVIFYGFGLYRGIWRYTSLWDIINIGKATVLSSLFFIIVFGLFHGFAGFPRSVFVIDFILTVITISLVRITVRLYFSHFGISRSSSKEYSRKRLMLIGAGRTGEKIAREIVNSNSSPYEIAGFVDDDPSKVGALLHGYKILGTINDLPDISIPYDELLITAPSATGDEIRRIIDLCKRTGKRYKTVPSLAEIIDNDISIKSIREVSYLDLLGREEVKLDMNSIDQLLHGKRVLVTGAGGSIGSELVRQCLNFSPGMLMLLDNSEFNLFSIEKELNQKKPRTSIRAILGDIRDEEWLKSLFNEKKPQVILHAAAYKHVPIQERHPREAVLTNIGGTMNLINAAIKYKSEKFVLVSTDKAVHPVNVMGATKRLAEIMIQSLHHIPDTKFMAVRFGNVIGSSGSVVPLFQDQIKNGGPVKITHPDMIRYFMSITEASQLILQAGALGKGGEVFVLDMGKPVRIKDMAYDLIRLSGLEPEKDISVIYTGVRTGEKLFEELVTSGENVSKTEHYKIMIMRNKVKNGYSWLKLCKEIESLLMVASTFAEDSVKSKLQSMLPEYEPGEIPPSPKKQVDWDVQSKSFEA